MWMDWMNGICVSVWQPKSMILRRSPMRSSKMSYLLVQLVYGSIEGWNVWCYWFWLSSWRLQVFLSHLKSEPYTVQEETKVFGGITVPAGSVAVETQIYNSTPTILAGLSLHNHQRWLIGSFGVLWTSNWGVMHDCSLNRCQPSVEIQSEPSVKIW
jgi:hypothetical protein